MTRIRASFIAILILSGGSYVAWQLRPATPAMHPVSPPESGIPFQSRFQVSTPASPALEPSPVLLDIDARDDDFLTSRNPTAEGAFGVRPPAIARVVASEGAEETVTSNGSERLVQLQRRMDQLPIPRLASRYDQAAQTLQANRTEPPSQPDTVELANSAPRPSRQLTPIPDPLASAWLAAEPQDDAPQQDDPTQQDDSLERASARRSPMEDPRSVARVPERLPPIDNSVSPMPVSSMPVSPVPPAADFVPSNREPSETTRRPIRPPTKGSFERWHRIQDGDTVESLARRYLGAEDRAAELIRANPKVLADPLLLPIGARIRIPD